MAEVGSKEWWVAIIEVVRETHQGATTLDEAADKVEEVMNDFGYEIYNFMDAWAQVHPGVSTPEFGYIGWGLEIGIMAEKARQMEENIT